MDLTSIGKHIRKKRVSQGWSMDQLAEKADITVSYIGMIERGEKIPKLATFIRILNALNISADEVLEDVTNVGYQARMSSYQERIESLSKRDRETVYKIIDVFLREE